MEKTAENGSRKFLSVVPFETIEPYMVDITEDPPAITLEFFQRDLYCHLDGREKLWYLCDHLLDWLKEAKRLRPNQASVLMTMDDPIASEKEQRSAEQVQDALVAEFGTDDERAVLQRKQKRKEANPRSKTATPLQEMMSKLYRVCLDHSESSTEGVTLVNPDNPAVYMRIGHERLKEWAQAIIDGIDGVDTTHPPNKLPFEWVPRPGTSSTSTSISEDLIALVNPINNQRAWSTGRATSSIVNRGGEAGFSAQSPLIRAPLEVPGQHAHFNNDRTPLPILGVEQRGTMTAFLENAMIPLDDHYTQILIEHHKIHHWTYFRRSTMLELLGMGFAAGPSCLLIDAVPLFESVLRHTSPQ
ncbi:uncharacterized protein PGTG_11186 [Puccinia graminis f. sp. tritici CRL 75-36-700-3]|uniref:Uncharacterized protein n=1 Tax=Puccinia graminis f. sp. tritici (strain CRL 75-36-700-3 / race SCCL) TaxID=418459 RepID=E3KL42_PUCGT|nr:uncharacterized protein PGTG_11186 [Puccinia graminis f. sp. tritici CRL 75-36-700-3]EFP85017.2 hypothetical protein PGTG_11186 [Puccinia graminis f. sp. tritici CRL 75-36-700-3]